MESSSESHSSYDTGTDHSEEEFSEFENNISGINTPEH